MSLKYQIIIIIFSFIFGIFFGFLVNLNYKIIFNKKNIIRLLGSFFLCLDMSLLYFLIILKINYGILHIYFLFVLFLGFYIGITGTRKIRKW